MRTGIVGGLFLFFVLVVVVVVPLGDCGSCGEAGGRVDVEVDVKVVE